MNVCLEIGPPSLSESIVATFAGRTGPHVITPSWLPAESGGIDLLAPLGKLYAAGADFCWRHLIAARGRCVHLPSYAWQRQRLWMPISKRPAAAPVERESPDSGAAEDVRRRSDLTVPYVAPQTKLETALAESWSAVLGIDRVGIHDNFLELGGDSLRATILLNRLQEQLGEPVPAHMLFYVQTIGELAAYLQNSFPDAVRRFNGGAEIAATEGPAASPVSSIRRLAREDQAKALLERLDELSDEEVESLLDGEVIASEVLDE